MGWQPDKSGGRGETKFVLKKNDLIIQIRSGDWGLDRGACCWTRGEGCRQSRQEDVRGKAIATLGSTLQCDNGCKHLAFLHLLRIGATKIRPQM